MNIKKKGKYLDLDFTPEKRIVTEPNTRTDTARVFSAGTVSETEFFFSKSRVILNLYLAQ
jgi:thioredoxin reductase